MVNQDRHQANQDQDKEPKDPWLEKSLALFDDIDTTLKQLMTLARQHHRSRSRSSRSSSRSNHGSHHERHRQTHPQEHRANQ
jgi:hypothetical protein